MNIYTSPVFLQAASNINRTPVEPVGEIKLRYNAKNQSVELSCDGEIEVAYIQNGVAKKDTYTDLSSTEVYFGCDANTDVVITGKVTEIDLSSKDNLTSAKISNTALTQLNCSSCYALTSLDLSTNTALTKLNCSNCIKVEVIYALAENSDVADAIAGLITNAESETGTVYVNSADTHYSTIETAANDKGWTIEPLPEA